MYIRQCKIELPDKKSAFLWGARQTGKSYFLKHHFK
jgi:predicted AAA+ superfamily ATPase